MCFSCCISPYCSPASITSMDNMKRTRKWKKKHTKYWRYIKSRKRRLQDEDHKSNGGHNRGELLEKTNCRGFKCSGLLVVFLVPCHIHLHARFDATSKSECSQCFRETLLFTTGSTALGVTLFSPCRALVSSPFASTRWRCWCIL